VLDFRRAGRNALNRWNESSDPTLYLAGDEGVLIAEWGRHFAVNRTPALQAATVERTAYRLSLEVGRVLDLRSPDVWRLLSLADAPGCFTNRSIARAAATFVRRTTAAQALLVPSIVFLDQLDRWCLVLFLEKLPAQSEFITAVTPVGPLRRG
jgi:RES domain-containing protein